MYFQYFYSERSAFGWFSQLKKCATSAVLLRKCSSILCAGMWWANFTRNIRTQCFVISSGYLLRTGTMYAQFLKTCRPLLLQIVGARCSHRYMSWPRPMSVLGSSIFSRASARTSHRAYGRLLSDNGTSSWWKGGTHGCCLFIYDYFTLTSLDCMCIGFEHTS